MSADREIVVYAEERKAKPLGRYAMWGIGFFYGALILYMLFGIVVDRLVLLARIPDPKGPVEVRAIVRNLKEGMTLDSKHIMEEAMPELERIRELVPERLHLDFEDILEDFEDEMAEAEIKDNEE
jgi:hypothetical protein